MKSGMSVFLIDDDKLFVLLTKKTINATHLVNNIQEFNDGERAIEYLKGIAGDAELLPDVIFLDLSMPIMDGWGFLKEFMLLEPVIAKKICLYVFSSSISPHDMEKARNIPVVRDYVVKPIEKARFIDLLVAC